jgi:Holliday junction resolvase-like predicted endonuclease
VIAEVKTKTSTQKGTPQEMVHFFKQRKLRTLARELSQKYPDQPIRIDVVAILQQPDGTHSIDYIQNAVEGN